MAKKKEQKKGVWMMAFIAFIMITSVIGFIWKGNPKVRYNNFVFTQEENGAWTTEVSGQKIALNYNPEELEYIDIDPMLSQRLNTIEVDTTYDQEDPYAEYIAKVQYVLEEMMPFFDVYVVRGFTSENEFARPVVTCENATQFVPVVYFKKSNQTRISIEDNCVIAEAYRPEDLLKLKDILVYSILGVMQ